MRQVFRSVKRRVIDLLERSDSGFRLSLRLRYGATGPHGRPQARWHNAVLKSRKEADDATLQVRSLGLPGSQNPEKDWDSLAALDLLLASTDSNAQVFDAGGERYSMILPWLYLYGYRRLSAGNLTFRRTSRRGPIVYRYSDITDTELGDATMDAVTCMSVIEHGVDLESYFREMSRILKPGGLLITSTDYFETPIDTGGQLAYGVPIRIFSRDEITDALEIAGRFGLTLTGPLDLRSDEQVVHWRPFDLHYTFVVFALRKDGDSEAPTVEEDSARS